MLVAAVVDVIDATWVIVAPGLVSVMLLAVSVTLRLAVTGLGLAMKEPICRRLNRRSRNINWPAVALSRHPRQLWHACPAHGASAGSRMKWEKLRGLIARKWR